MSDTIVYAVNCTWWDNIDKAKVIDGGLPCCPDCGSPLFEMHPDDWEAGIDAHNDIHPGYAQFMAWARGKCHKNLAQAMSYWCQEMAGER